MNERVDEYANEQEVLTVTKRRYEELLAAEAKLTALLDFGVDNWEGYSDAMRSLGEER